MGIVVENRAVEVAKEILSRNYIDVDELAAALKVSIYMAVEEVLRSEVEKLLDRKAELSSIIHAGRNTGHIKAIAHKELAKISVELKKRNKAIVRMEDESDRKLIRRFIAERYGKEFWNDFNEYKSKLKNANK